MTQTLRRILAVLYSLDQEHPMLNFLRRLSQALSDEAPSDPSPTPDAEQHGSVPSWPEVALSLERKLHETVEAAHGLEAERDQAYRERAHLLAWLAALHPAVIAPAPDVDEPGWQLLYLTPASSQLSWHISPRDAELFAHVKHVPADDPRAQWDGHTTDEKYERIRALIDAPAGVAVEPLTPASGLPPTGHCTRHTGADRQLCGCNGPDPEPGT